MDYYNRSLRQIYDEGEAIARDAKSHFGHLGAQQLNWKPSADSWSVAQCLDHLITINRAYYPTFERVLRGEHRPSFLHRLPVLPSLMGRLMVKTLSPSSRRKLKAPAASQPSFSDTDPNIVERFVTHQHELLAAMKSLEVRSPATTVITSPFAGAVVYSLLDTFRLLVAHERRHFAQAQRVMATDGFPRGNHSTAGGLPN